jgi:hypothetical protein
MLLHPLAQMFLRFVNVDGWGIFFRRLRLDGQRAISGPHDILAQFLFVAGEM